MVQNNINVVQHIKSVGELLFQTISAKGNKNVNITTNIYNEVGDLNSQNTTVTSFKKNLFFVSLSLQILYKILFKPTFHTCTYNICALYFLLLSCVDKKEIFIKIVIKKRKSQFSYLLLLGLERVNYNYSIPVQLDRYKHLI